jgi:hypothetical protein
MGKLLVSVCCALAILATAAVSDARIYVRISDGTVAVDGRTQTGGVKGNLKLAQNSFAPTGTLDAPIDSLFLITCPPSTPRPCKAFFPSGNPTSAQPGDTFKLEDDASGGARLEKFDSGASSDRVSIKLLRVTALGAGKVLTITYGNEAGDLRALTSTQAAAYAVTAAMSGNFRAAVNSLTKASACKVGLVSADLDSPDDSCLKLTVTVNGSAPIDGQGLPSIATLSVPCNNSFPTLSPCGPGALGWSASNGGKFTGLNDSKSISCPSSCLPAHQGILVAKFNAANEVLQLTASTHGTMAYVTDENGGGEENLLALATEIGLPRWVTYAAAIERCRAEFKTPSDGGSHNASDANQPISVELWCGDLTPAGSAGIPLLSLADTLLLPGAASTRFAASRETFVPAQSPPQGPLKFKDINTLSFLWDQVVGPETNPLDNRLKDTEYVDCMGGSTRLEIPVRSSQGADLGVVRVYLGSTDFGRKDCNGFEQAVGADVVGNQLARVDLSGLAGNLAAPCCVTWAQARSGSLGNALVRKIAFVVSRPVSPESDPDVNFKVTFFDGNVNGVTALSSLMVATGFTRVPTAQLNTTGVSIVITRLLSPVLNLPLGVIKVFRSGNLATDGNKFSVTPNMNLSDLTPESGGKYGFSLCPSGVETDFILDPSLYPDPNTAVLGICIANHATLTLN